MTAKIVKEDGDLSNSCHSESGSEEPSINQSRLNALMDFKKEPYEVKRRVNALKNLLLQFLKLETSFYDEVLEIEKKYEEKYSVLLLKRRQYVSGLDEPDDVECSWPVQGDFLEEIDQEISDKDQAERVPVSGIPDFWLKAMSHIDMISEMIVDADRPILSHLEDICCTLVTGPDAGFIIEFSFSTNDYFTNDVLRKHYFFKRELPSPDPFDYDGPEIIRTKGCVINWNPGKNITIKVIKKTKKHKKRKESRIFTRTVKTDSFFNFFDPPLDSLDDGNIEDDTVELLEEDFKIGHFIRQSLIPRAVLYFTGEAVESDIEDDCNDLEDEEFDEFEDESDHSDDHKKDRGKYGKIDRGFGDKESKSSKSERPECNQC